MSKANLKLFTVVLVAVMSTGCSTTHFIKKEEKFNLYKFATLHLSNNYRIDIKNAYTKDDSIIAIDYYTNRKLHYHKFDIQKITVSE